MNRHDPDIIICHDSSYIIDTLILRMQALSTNKYDRPRLGRFVITHELSKHNQVQRITSSLAGRLLADTYLHAKDMIKSVDYDLTAMSKHIDSESTFRTLAD